MDGWVLEYICAIQVQENAPDHDHLLTMGLPTRIHSFKENMAIHRLCHELLNICLHMFFC